ncbi:peptide chain release factor N(5)-glutamine methyltransferase [Mariniflexile ostreae]|uniref:Release factor glutamine methyltransferase n=1 Tax=Mariniflexile ostreae TaxID=1520892 RepID=A0ABV5FEL1_9FLAO
MRLKDIQNSFHQALDAMYSSEEVDHFFYMLLAFYYKVSRLQLALNTEMEVEDFKPIGEALELLKQQQPIQYIMGETEFYSLTFKVNPHVLIPRPETEGLVEWVIEEAEQDKEIKILDIGTGSGCIAISLAKNLPNAKVYALDISQEALSLAKKNATLNTVDVVFVEADILKQEMDGFVLPCTSHDNKEKIKFDIIVSNPPYVREQEKQLMKANVLENEPHLALFVKDERPLVFYNAIAHFATYNLEKGGRLFFEINEYLGDDMIRLLESKAFEKTVLKQDIFKKDRMIKACLG